MTRYTYYPNDALKVAKPIVIPRVVDYRMKPPRELLAHSERDCAPQFRSIWQGLGAGWFLLEETSDLGQADDTGDVLRDEIGESHGWYDYEHSAGGSYVLSNHGLAYSCVNGSEFIVTDIPAQAIDSAVAGTFFVFYTHRSIGSVAGIYPMQLDPAAGPGYVFINHAADGTLVAAAANVSDQGVFGIDTDPTADWTAVDVDYAFCLTWDYAADEVRLYMNQELVGSDTFSAVPSTIDRARIFNSNADNADLYYGAMWNRALTPAEVRLLSANPFGPFWKGAY